MGDGLWVKCILAWGLVWVCVRECGGKDRDIFRNLAQLSVRKNLPAGGVLLKHDSSGAVCHCALFAVPVMDIVGGVGGMGMTSHIHLVKSLNRNNDGTSLHYVQLDNCHTIFETSVSVFSRKRV